MSERSLLAAQFFNTERPACSRSMTDFCSSHWLTATAWRITPTGTFRLRALRTSSLPSSTVLPVTPAPTRLLTVGKTTLSPGSRVRSVLSWIIASISVPK